MRVLVVEPGYEPYEKEIEDTLAAKQEIVGGLLTVSYPYEEKIGIVSNDESILLGMEFNRSIPGGYGGIFGPFFVCGLGEEDFISLTDEEIARFKKEFHKAEVLIGVQGNEPVTLKVEPKKKDPGERPRKPQHPER